MNSHLDINNLSFNNYKITIVLDDNGEPWFKAKDIAQALDYINMDHCIRKNIDKKTLESLVPFWEKRFLGDEKNSLFINESSLYSLILSSKKEEAKKFKGWIIREVLPSFL